MSDENSVAETVNSAAAESQVSETQQGAEEAAAKSTDTQLLGDPASVTAGTGESDAKSSNNVPAQDRIRQLVAQRNQEKAAREKAEQDAAYYKARAEALTPKPAGARADHPSDEAWQEAIVESAVTKAQHAAALESAKEAEQRALRIRTQSFEARAVEFKEKAADFDAVARNPTLPISPIMGEAIQESESGPQIAYYLGKNPSEAARIASLPAVKQAAEIGRLEAQLSVPAKRTSQAPAPVKTVTTGSGSGAINPDSASMSDYVKWRRSQGA